MSMSRRVRWVRRILIGFLVCAAAAWLITPMVARAVIRSRLQAMIADQLDARLDIGDLVYHAPFGVTVVDASLVAPGPDGKPLELLRVPRLELSLARSPFGAGPLVIQSLVITDPAVHLIRTKDGIAGCRIREQAAMPSSAAAPASASPRTRLSDILQITHFALQGGQIIYEDRTRDAVPLVWRNLNVDLNTSPQADASYSFHLMVNNSPLATLEASGSADLDDLVLRVQKCALSVNVDPDKLESALSAELQEPLRAWRARGTLNIEMSGTLPLRDPTASTYQTTLQLHQASAYVPGWNTSLDRCALKLVLTDGSEQRTPGRPAYAPGQRPTARIELLEAKAGDAVFQLRDALAVADRSESTWTLTGLAGHIDSGRSRGALHPVLRDMLDRLHIRGVVDFTLDASGPLQSQDLRKFAAHLGVTPDDFAIQPPGMTSPIDGIGPLEFSLRDGTLTLDGVRGACAGSDVFVKQARVSYAQPPGHDVPLQLADVMSAANLGNMNFTLTGVTGHIDPGRSRAALPPVARDMLDRLHIRGAVDFTLDASGPLQSQDLRKFAAHLGVTPHDFAIQPPGMASPIDGIGPLEISLRDGALTLDGVRGACGGSNLFVKQARVWFANRPGREAPLQLAEALSAPNLANTTFVLTGVTGHIDPAGSRAALPPAWREQVDRLHLLGAVDFKLDASGPMSGPMQGRDFGALTAHLELTPLRFSLQPPGVDRPIDGITPLVISVANGAIALEAVRTACGGNLLFIKQASVALDDFPQRIRVSNLSGCLTFGPEQKYPTALAETLDQYKPVGPFFFDGFVDIDTAKPQDKVGYRLQVHTKRGRLALTQRRIPITNIDTIVDLTPDAVVVSRFEAAAFSGSASATGRVGLRGRTTYQLTAAMRNVDLSDLRQYLAKPGQAPPPLSGRGVLTVTLAGTVPGGNAPAYQGLTGSGEFEILGGDFWRVPIMKSISDSVSVTQAATVGEAAGQFHVGNGKIHFDRALASAPILGIEGSGDIDFNGNLDFKIIANVLGQWSERVGDIGDGGGIAKLLGAVQKGINIATQKALYQVALSGSVSNPQAHAIPSPFLNEQITRLLGAAMDKSRKTGLLDTLHNDPAPK